MIHRRIKGLGELHPTAVCSDRKTEVDIQDGGFQVRTKSDTDISACRQIGTKSQRLNYALAYVYGHSYPTGVVEIICDRIFGENYVWQSK